MYVKQMNFKCHLYGVLVYNSNFSVDETPNPGFWTNITPFDVPSVAPDAEYFITITA
jgi:hypothetical protein